jgi:tol-pal system protein YbgF
MDMKYNRVKSGFLKGCALITFTLLGHAALAVPMQQVDSEMVEQLNHEIHRLRQDLSMMQKEFYQQQTNKSISTSDRPRGEVSSQVEVQISQMEEYLRQMNGRVEEVQHMNHQLQQKLNQTIEMMEYRLVELEKRKVVQPESMVRTFPAPAENTNQPGDLGAIESNQKNMTTNGIATNTETEEAEGADKAAFEEAKRFLELTQYDQAATKFTSFITTYPSSTYLPEAHYWQGELHVIRDEKEKAAIAFLKAYQANAKGDKAGESLVRLGSLLGGMGKKQEACTTFDKAIKEFPKLVDLNKKITQERERIGC